MYLKPRRSCRAFVPKTGNTRKRERITPCNTPWPKERKDLPYLSNIILTQNLHWKSIAALTPFDIKHFLDFYSWCMNIPHQIKILREHLLSLGFSTSYRIAMQILGLKSSSAPAIATPPSDCNKEKTPP